MKTLVARSAFLAVLVVVVVPAMVAPAGAVLGGAFDGDEHPEVAGLFVQVPGRDARTLFCSGTLVAPQTVLTAAHCLSPLNAFGLVPSDVVVTFDPRPAGERRDGRLFLDEGSTDHLYGVSGWTGQVLNRFDDPEDVGLVFLDRPVDGIAPATVVAPGVLTREFLKDRTFTSVGYGVDERLGNQSYAGEGVRRNAEGGFLSLTQAWLKASGTPSSPQGNTCYGDSGGPMFIEIAGERVLVGLISTGDTVCRATNVGYRADTPAAQELLAQAG